jgi:hypothetical protein
MDTDTFELYKPLGPRRIRLLRIDVVKSAANIGSFEDFELDDAPPYYALSHTWGTKKQDVPIHIDGALLHVSEHLAVGLRRLRRLADANTTLVPALQYVWIDNICINQQDLIERSLQVRLMGNIYSRAIRTLIWLGPAFEDSGLAWKLVDEIYGLLKRQHPSIAVPEEMPNRMFSDLHHTGTRLPSLADDGWQKLHELFSIQWFSRIWVVQEVVLSPQDPFFLHGEHMYPWHRVEWAASWLRRNGYLRIPQIPEGLLYIDSIGYLRRAKADWPLSALMSITQKKFHATNQKDKVYSLLGLAAESTNPYTMPTALIPDYTIDLQQTYMNVTRYFLENEGSLAILTRTRGTQESISRKRRQHDFGEWPSWLPDWSDFGVHDRELRKSFSWIHYGDTTKPARLGFPKQYRAAGDLTLRMHTSPDPNTLRLSGLRVDKIKQALQMSNAATFVDAFKNTFDAVMLRILTLIRPLTQHAFEIWTTQLIKSTTADQQPLSGRTWEQGLKDGYAYLHSLLSGQPSLLNLATRHVPTQTEALVWLQQAAEDGDPAQYAALARNFCYDRSFVVTEAGRLGIGPSDSRVGDSVAVIPGGGVPYLLRPDGAAWTFVGEAYINGIMSGEMVEGCVVMEALDLR